MFSFTKKGIRFKKYTPSELAIRRVCPDRITLPVGELFLMPGDRVFAAKSISTLDGREVPAPCDGRFVGTQSVQTARGEVNCAVIQPEGGEKPVFSYNFISTPTVQALTDAAGRFAPIAPDLPPLANRLAEISDKPIVLRALDDGPDRAAANAVLCGHLKEIVSAAGWLEKLSGRGVTICTNNLTARAYVKDHAFDVAVRAISGKYPSAVWLKRALDGTDAVELDVREVYALFHTVAYGCPPLDIVVTVSTWGGSCDAVEVPLGTPISALFDEIPSHTRVIANGVLCGRQVPLTTPITPEIDALTLTEFAADQPATCINCGQCAQHCPMGLSPGFLNEQYRRVDAKTARKYGADRCIACGACNYLCPSKLPLMQRIRAMGEGERDA